jgi:pyrroloquinoline quinone (PQQ) biosynthesis protein C
MKAILIPIAVQEHGGCAHGNRAAKMNDALGTNTTANNGSAMAPDDFLQAIWLERRRYVREGRIKQPHPWRVALSEGRVTRSALVEYVKNRYYFLANINRKDAQVIANCPISDARRMPLRKYIDEEGQDVAGGQLGPHHDLWLKVSDELGVPRAVMQSYDEVLPVYRYTVMRCSTSPGIRLGSKG